MGSSLIQSRDTSKEGLTRTQEIQETKDSHKRNILGTASNFPYENSNLEKRLPSEFVESAEEKERRMGRKKESRERKAIVEREREWVVKLKGENANEKFCIKKEEEKRISCRDGSRQSSQCWMKRKRLAQIIKKIIIIILKYSEYDFKIIVPTFFHEEKVTRR